MEFDPNNAAVQLCVKGMTAEGEGNIEEAKQFFQQAWDTATNNFEAFTAAHYLARNQADPNIELKWNPGGPAPGRCFGGRWDKITLPLAVSERGRIL